ncbi:MAG: ABC transporter permease subunit [Pirellulales bacterium]
MDLSFVSDMLLVAQAAGQEQPGPQTAGQNDYWLSKWMTPFWFVGVGILLGLLAIVLLVVLLKILSKVRPWAALSENPPVGHGVAAAISVLISFGLFRAVQGFGFDGQEQLLVYLALLFLSSIVGWTLVFGSNAQAARGVVGTLTEGVASILGVVLVVVMVVGLASTLIVREPVAALRSIPKIFETGVVTLDVDLKGIGEQNPDTAPLEKVKLPIDVSLLDKYTVTTSGTVVFGDSELVSEFRLSPKRLTKDEQLIWVRKTDGLPSLAIERGAVFIQNREVDSTRVSFVLETLPAVPQAATILITALAVLLLGMAVIVQQAAAPRASAVALATIKNELAQPLFTVLVLLGFAAIVLFEFLSFNTLGEDIKLLKDCGITVIMLMAAFQGIWSASSSISEEIEGRTALTILSKPIQRRSFVIGKFLGIFWVVAMLFLILGIAELGAVAYKPIYEARENSLEEPIWQDCHREMISTVPGLVLGLMQATVLSAISVALATRLPQLANISVCFAVYLVGHLATAIVSSTAQGFEIVKFVAQLVATIIPILEHFSMQAAIDSGTPITMSLLAGTLIYCLLYVLMSMFLALLLFEDRDLA